MMRKEIPFRGFKGSELVISSYPDGVVKFDLVCGDRLLAELSLDLVSRMSGCVYFKDAVYTEEVLRKMMGEDILDFFVRTQVDGLSVFVAGLSGSMMRALMPPAKRTSSY